jgi:hypothetical protein
MAGCAEWNDPHIIARAVIAAMMSFGWWRIIAAHAPHGLDLQHVRHGINAGC